MGKKLLKLLLTILLVAGAAVLCWGLTLYYEWRPWVGVALFLAILAVVFGYGFARRVIYRTRQRLIDAQARRNQPKDGPIERPVDIRGQWKAAIATLKGSSLRKRGDPVYVLPWYMVIGKQGSGKTTALTRARLTSPIKEVRTAVVVPETKGIDWWYFDRAVMIDTTGHYVAAEGAGNARSDWTKLLGMLAKTRSKEPLNGLVVTVGADLLLFGTPDSMAEEGRLVRGRVDDLMKVLDAKFPIYLVVTKCDALYGLDEWANNLPPKKLDQALGYCGGVEGMSTSEFLDQAFTSVVERMRDLRLVLSRRFKRIPAGLLLLPNEFERLRPGLEKFFSSAFGENPYLETPLLRGMFFTSGIQRGGASSYVLKDSGLAEETTMMAGSAKGLFLHDLFDRVIPNDRNLFRSLGRFTRWERITRSFGYSAWLLAALAVGIALTASFHHNVRTFQEVSAGFPGAGRIVGNTTADLDTLRRQYLVIRELEARNRHWETRYLWLGSDAEALETKLRNAFIANFRKSVLNRVDQQLAYNLNLLAEGSGEIGRSAFIQFVVRRLNLLQARIDAADYQKLAGMPQSSPGGLAVLRLASLAGSDDMSPATAKGFDELYTAYLAWNPDLNSLGNERDSLKRMLRQLALNSDNLNWLVAWANEQTGLAPVRLTDFWPGEAGEEPTAMVEAGFTTRGLEAINGFFTELQAAAAEPQAMNAKRKAFESGYRAQRFEAWRLFVENFDLGRDLQRGEARWRTLLPTMATVKSPYFQLIERVSREFDGPEFAVGAPDWVRVARQLVAIKPVGRKEGLADAAARATGVINATGKQIIEKAIGSGPAGGRAVFENFVQAAKAYEALYADLAKIVDTAVDGSGSAQKLYADFHLFGVDPNVKESALRGAYASIAKLRTMMGGTSTDNQAAWQLAAGPLDFIVAFVQEQCACALQKDWDANVFFGTQGASSNADLGEQLYGAKGTVWTFANDTARAFLRRTALRYEPVETLGSRVNFTPEFIAFVNDGNSRKAAQAETSRRGESDQKRQQLVQQQVQLDRERQQIERQKREQTLTRRQQETQKSLRELDQWATETRAATEQLRAQNHSVTVNAQPTGVNAEAKFRPFQTILSVQCSPTPSMSLNNFNFPVGTTFNWSQTTCGDTILQIRIESLTLVRRYAGPLGFARFVQEFYSGTKVFVPMDFPAQQAQLEALDIKTISVRYTFSGQELLQRGQEQLQTLAQMDRDRQKERARLEALRDRIEQELQEEKQTVLAGRTENVVEDRSEVGRRIEALDRPPPPVDVSSVPRRIVACWEDIPRRSPFTGVPSAQPAGRRSAPAEKDTSPAQKETPPSRKETPPVPAKRALPEKPPAQDRLAQRDSAPVPGRSAARETAATTESRAPRAVAASTATSSAAVAAAVAAAAVPAPARLEVLAAQARLARAPEAGVPPAPPALATTVPSAPAAPAAPAGAAATLATAATPTTALTPAPAPVASAPAATPAASAAQLAQAAAWLNPAASWWNPVTVSAILQTSTASAPAAAAATGSAVAMAAPTTSAGSTATSMRPAAAAPAAAPAAESAAPAVPPAGASTAGAGSAAPATTSTAARAAVARSASSQPSPSPLPVAAAAAAAPAAASTSREPSTARESAAVARGRHNAAMTATELPPRVPGAAYAVQIGVFKEDAIPALVARLRKANIPVVVGAVTLRDGSVYQQVRNGPYADLQTAREAAARITEASGLKALVMKPVLPWEPQVVAGTPTPR
jgi:type VI secretion system protein ImpL